MPAFLDAPPPIAIAHRGGAAAAPENSLAAFAHAVELGYRYAETDVHVTADGVLVAFHDHTLERVTDGSGVVANLPWSQVREARIGGREPIPRFAEILTTWPDLRLVVDPKADGAVEPLIAELQRLDAVDRVCVGSFAQDRLNRVRAALGPRLCTSAGPPEVRRIRLASWGLLPRSAVGAGPDCLQVPLRRGPVPLADRRLVDLAHGHGLPVHVWTVDRPAEMRRLLDLGVDGIVTDDVAALRGVLVERGAWR